MAENALAMTLPAPNSDPSVSNPSPWLTTLEFAELAGIARQNAHAALMRCLNGKTWRDTALDVVMAEGTGGKGGKSFAKRFESGAAASKQLESTDPKLGAALKQLCIARDSIVAEIKILDKKIEERHAARSRLLNDPVSKSEYMDFVKAELERRAANFAGPLNGAIASAPKGYGELSRALAKGPAANINYLTDRILPDRVTDAAICFYFGEAIIGKLTAVVDGMGWPDGSVPCAKRDELIALADSEIDDLTSQRDELAASLTRVGMTG